MYIVTGGAGFIGSAFVSKLNSLGISDIIIVDSMGTSGCWKNLRGKKFSDYMHKDALLNSSILNDTITAIIHMGASSSTTEMNADYLMENNYRYTRVLAELALARDIRFIYASTAATYGDGRNGFSDEDSATPPLYPINPYGYSKQLFDEWALRTGALRKITGLKFFNVYGPNEYHKAGQRSVVLQAFEQIRDTGKINLYKSYRPEYKDGEQKRDFIYVKDCTEVMAWLLNRPEVNGLFNLGTGRARTWNDLINSVFAAMGKAPIIEYIDMPENLRKQYQYFTEASMEKLRRVGCAVKIRDIEEGVKDYVQSYLMKDYAEL
jgi:ADP-L-glycero-D-manno-heptose 6-epimerase